MRILIVDDHADGAEFLAVFLRHRGHQVTAVTTAADALALCAGGAPFDALVADIGLPDVDGWALLPRLRRVCEIPAIALSAYARQSDVDKSIATGYCAHLTKPVNLLAIAEALEKVAPAAVP